MYKLRDWIPESKIDIVFLCQNEHPAIIPMITPLLSSLNLMGWYNLCENPIAAEIILQNLNNINKVFISGNTNPQIVNFLKKNPDIIDWEILNTNHAAIDLIKSNPDKINWPNLSFNKASAAIELLHKNEEYINWHLLSFNKSAIKLLEKNQDKIHWGYFSMNSAAIDLLEKNFQMRDPGFDNLSFIEDPYYISWKRLCLNPAAIHIVKANPTKINWECLSKNPAAIELLEQNQGLVDWSMLSSNPAIFVCDYAAMRASRAALHEEFAAAFWHPRRVARYMEMDIELEDI